MGKKANEDAVRRSIKAFNARHWKAYAADLVPDVVIEYPQSGERFVGSDKCMAQLGAAPSSPHLTLKRMQSSGDQVVAELDEVYDSGDTWNAVMIYQFKDGKIVREVGYWGKKFSAPRWRKPFAAP